MNLEQVLREYEVNRFRRIIFLLVISFPVVPVMAESNVKECRSLYTAENYERAVAPCKKAAGQGNGEAQFILGRIYHNGLGVQQDYKQAFKWYSWAASQGYADADSQTFLGQMYYHGEDPAGRLSFEDTIKGTGPAVKAGDTIRVHYTARLTDGTEFDSSVKRDRPFEFPLGRGRVIKGLDLGVVGMQAGGKRTLIIPPEHGYGARAAGKIPPDSTLVFDIELIEIISLLPDAQGDDTYKGTAVRNFKTDGNVAVTVYKEGEGRAAQPGDIVEVHYTGTLASDGSRFDSSIKRGLPFKFTVGKGRVIKGLDEAIIGMRTGELRRIEIPAVMAYGERARPKIPANSDLVFTIELMRVSSSP